MPVTRGTTLNTDWTLNESASTASLTCVLPSAMAAGKVLVAHVRAATTAGLPATGGWAWASAGFPLTGAGTSMGLAFTTTAAPGLAFTQATADRFTVILVVYSGQAATVMDVTPSTVIASQASPVVAGSITTITDGDMLVTGWGLDASTVTTITQPAGYTLVARHTSGTGKAAAFADLSQTTQGATGTASWADNQGTVLVRSAYLAAIRAATAATVPNPPPRRRRPSYRRRHSGLWAPPDTDVTLLRAA